MGRKKLQVPLPKAPDAPIRANAYERFNELGSEKFAAVDTMLLKGDSPAQVAAVIQDEWGMFTDTKANTLQKQLKRYYDKILHPRFLHMQAKVEAGAVGGDKRSEGPTRAVLERLCVMEEFEALSAIQKKRIEKLWRREQGMPEGVTLDALSKLMMDQVRTLTAIGNLQLETGYLKRAPKVITGQLGVHDPFNPGSMPVFDVAFEIQQRAREGVGELAQLLHEVIEGECERVEPGRAALPEAAAGEPGGRSAADGSAAEDAVPPAGGDGAGVPERRGRRGSRPA